MVERDVADLRREGKRFPGHVSVILELKEGARDGESSVERFVREAGDIACWSAAAGVNTLSIYERSGTGKRVASRVREGVESAVRAYFAGRSGKSVSVRAVNAPGEVEDEEEVDLEVLLLSEEDGREAMVDLTKTLCEMAQRGKVQLEEVGQELVDEELKGTLPHIDDTNFGGSSADALLDRKCHG